MDRTEWWGRTGIRAVVVSGRKGQSTASVAEGVEWGGVESAVAMCETKGTARARELERESMRLKYTRIVVVGWVGLGFDGGCGWLV